ncbi:MAG: polyprenyl synthetase family protein [Planctomycetota bacterium]
MSSQDGEVQALLAELLAEVEARFAAELLSDLPSVNALAEHVERYRGKMLRPTLVMISAMAAYPKSIDNPVFRDRVTVVATVAEMVHMATLVHDDILDDAEMRRRGATINHLRGNEAAVMLGDYLISHAYHLCSSIPLPAASRAIAAATNTVCEGELLQLHHREDWRLNERTYFEIVRRKTASLCGACCRMPSVLMSGEPDGGDSASAAALFEFGEKLGIAFQIIDDVLDLTGDPAEVGKTLGRDLAKGKLTLPLIRQLATSNPEEYEIQVADMQRGNDPDAVARVRESLDRSDGLAYARDWAHRLVADAKSGIENKLELSEARNLLLEMADSVLNRKF